jgi:hypothetical protein
MDAGGVAGGIEIEAGGVDDAGGAGGVSVTAGAGATVAAGAGVVGGDGSTGGVGATRATELSDVVTGSVPVGDVGVCGVGVGCDVDASGVDATRSVAGSRLGAVTGR